VGNLLGTDATKITASIEPQRDFTPGAIAQRVAHANALCEAGAYGEALALLDRMFAIECADPEVHSARGWALENLGPARLPEARHAYESAIALDASRLWARLGLANVLGQLGEAGSCACLYQDAIEQAAARTAREPDLLELIGWSQYRLGWLDDAIATFRRALSLDEAWVSVRFDLGLALLVRGDEDKASQEYEAGLACLTAREPGRRLGPLSVALADLDDALVRLRSASQAVGRIRARLARTVNQQGDPRG
jgi:Flp pilus assembly protein TadD